MYVIFKLVINLFNILIFVAPISVGATCIDILEIHSKYKAGKEYKLLFTPKSIAFQKLKEESLDIDTKEFSSIETHLNIRNRVYDRELLIFLHENFISNEMKETIKVVRQAMLDKKLFKLWAKELIDVLIVQTYISKNTQFIEKLETKGRFSIKLIIDYLVESSKEGGFSGNYSDLYITNSNLSNLEFSRVLQRRQLIYDKAFRFSDHGSLSHMFQVNYSQYALRKAQINPRKFVEFYEWMGKNHVYDISEVKLFNSFTNVWVRLFDSPSLHDFSSPETLNTILKDYLNWTEDIFYIRRT